MKIVKGFKYRIYPTEDQKFKLDQQFFISNQTYNICLNLYQKDYELNKDLQKSERKYKTKKELYWAVKSALDKRNLFYKTRVIERAIDNFLNAWQAHFLIIGRGFPKFKKSNSHKQSFGWNNERFDILTHNNPRFKIFSIMRMKILLRYHVNLPEDALIKQISVSKQNEKYYVSFNVEYQNDVKQIDLKDLKSDKLVGIDLNINKIAINSTLIDTKSKIFSKFKYDKTFIRLQRKQSRRVLSLRSNKSLGSNFNKTQLKINKILEKVANRKKHYYNVISKEIVNNFDFIAVEDLTVKNMTKRPDKNIKQKRGLNKSILDASFYQLRNMIEYKAKHSGKLFIAVAPEYTSKTCSNCGAIKEDLSLSDRVYKCDSCGFTLDRDINASRNILLKGSQSFGLEANLLDFKQ